MVKWPANMVWRDPTLRLHVLHILDLRFHQKTHEGMHALRMIDYIGHQLLQPSQFGGLLSQSGADTEESAVVHAHHQMIANGLLHNVGALAGCFLVDGITRFFQLIEIVITFNGGLYPHAPFFSGAARCSMGIPQSSVEGGPAIAAGQ